MQVPLITIGESLTLEVCAVCRYTHTHGFTRSDPYPRRVISPWVRVGSGNRLLATCWVAKTSYVQTPNARTHTRSYV